MWIDIPLDVQAIQIDETSLPAFVPAEDVTPNSAKELDVQITAVIEAFNRSERPIIFAGNGIRLAHAEKELFELLDLLHAPVQTTWLTVNIIAESNPLFAGTFLARSPRAAQTSPFRMPISCSLSVFA